MQVRLSMGSTGNFARQIREGAPFEIFMAADEKFIEELHADGFTRDEGDLYAIGRVVIMASTEGGVEIEEVAAKHPEKIIKVAIDPACGFQPFHGRRLAYGLGDRARQQFGDAAVAPVVHVQAVRRQQRLE